MVRSIGHLAAEADGREAAARRGSAIDRALGTSLDIDLEDDGTARRHTLRKTTVSPGSTGLRNLTERSVSASGAWPVASAISISTRSSNTTPGTIGRPGSGRQKRDGRSGQSSGRLGTGRLNGRAKVMGRKS